VAGSSTQPAARLKELKQPVYVLREPIAQQYIALRSGELPKLAPLHLATIRPATPAGLKDLATLASERLAPYSIVHELVRVDAL
jgi:hypothetical protein